jgi:hypothetical protein
LSRFEGDITASGATRLSVADLLALLGGECEAGEAQRAQAIACYLSAGEGWKDAVKRLGGAFAAEAAASGTKDGKGD